MIQIEHSITIGRPRDEVFDFLTDVENIPEWQSNIVQSRALSDGPSRIGFQFEEAMKIGPLKVRALCTVTDLKPNERLAFEMKSGGPLDCDASFDLHPIANGTRLTLRGTARLKGLWRLLRPMVAAELRKETLAELMTMKALLEVPEPVLARSAI